jgi:hypothetical protein
MLVGKCLIALAFANGAFALSGGSSVAIDLATDRATYHVGEAIRLTLTIENTGDRSLFGYMVLEPYMPSDLRSSTLLYCREGAPCVEFLGKIRNVEYMDMEVTPIELGPGRRQKSQFVVALNPKTNALVADAPGDYEIRWTTWGIHDRRGDGPKVRGREVGASAFIRVLPMPPSEQAAYDLYVESKLAQMAQYDEAYGDYTDELRQAAHTMLVRFPNSIYADAVRIGFKKLLEGRVRRGRATEQDRTVLDELRVRSMVRD